MELPAESAVSPEYTIIQRSVFFATASFIVAYACLYIHRQVVIWRTIRSIPGPFARGWVGYFPPAYNIFCLVLQHTYAEFIDTSTGVFQLLSGLSYWFEKEGVYKLYLGFQPAIIVFRADAVEAVLSHTTNLKKPILYSLLHPWLGTGLLTSSGSKWRVRRKLLTPAFHFRILEDFLPVMCEQADVFVECLAKRVGTDFDIVPPVTCCTLDVICETAMGVRVHAQKDNKSGYVRDVYAVGKYFLERLVRPWLYPEVTYHLTREGRKFRAHVKGIHDFTKRVIRDRKKQKISGDINCEKDRRLAFLDLLLDEHMKNPAILSEEDIREEVDTFMFEGHDTTAMALSWTLFQLGHHPEEQRRCFEELEEIFGSDTRQPTTEDLKKMKYLECCIKEALRLFPSVPIIGREVHTTFNLGQHVVPAGCVVLITAYQLHRDSRIFPKPDEFIPDRFSVENSKGRHPYAFVPFSAGPRNCIGQKFALMEEKVILSTFLRKYSITSLIRTDEVVLAAELVLRSKHGLPVRLEERVAAS